MSVPADSLHPVAIAWSRALPGLFFTTEFVLLEVVNMLSQVSRRAKTRTLIAALYSNPKIQIEPASTELFRTGIALHATRIDKNWSLTDCISFEVMRAAGITYALTYDQHFVQAGFRALLRSLPPSGNSPT